MEVQRTVKIMVCCCYYVLWNRVSSNRSCWNLVFFFFLPGILEKNNVIIHIVNSSLRELPNRVLLTHYKIEIRTHHGNKHYFLPLANIILLFFLCWFLFNLSLSSSFAFCSRSISSALASTEGRMLRSISSDGETSTLNCHSWKWNVEYKVTRKITVSQNKIT